MTRSALAAALLATLMGAGLDGAALAASTAPPTDPQNLQGGVASPLTPRSSVYAPTRARRHVSRRHVSSQDVERQDFGRVTRK